MNSRARHQFHPICPNHWQTDLWANKRTLDLTHSYLRILANCSGIQPQSWQGTWNTKSNFLYITLSMAATATGADLLLSSIHVVLHLYKSINILKYCEYSNCVTHAATQVPAEHQIVLGTNQIPYWSAVWRACATRGVYNVFGNVNSANLSHLTWACSVHLWCPNLSCRPLIKTQCNNSGPSPQHASHPKDEQLVKTTMRWRDYWCPLVHSFLEVWHQVQGGIEGLVPCSWMRPWQVQ